MARPREFDFDQAVEGALQIFWRQGYHATNLPDLLKAMGLTRGSFYKAFGDKRAAYLMALRRYRDNELSAGIAFLTNALGAPAADRIVAFFNGIGKDGSRRGCFLCNAMVELAPSDPEVAASLQGGGSCRFLDERMGSIQGNKNRTQLG